MSKDEPVVYEIDLTKKYIIRFEKPMPMAEYESFQRACIDWMKGDDPFLVVFGNVKLVKVETADE